MPVGGGLYGREIEYGDDGPSLDFFVVAVWDLTSGLHLVNGGGYDYLFGGDGDDILISTEGTAYLSGGNGTDTFVIQSSVGSEYIADFNTGDGDVIDLRHVLTGYNPLSDDLNDFLQISDSGGNSILSVDPDGYRHDEQLYSNCNVEWSDGAFKCGRSCHEWEFVGGIIASLPSWWGELFTLAILRINHCRNFRHIPAFRLAKLHQV